MAPVASTTQVPMSLCHAAFPATNFRVLKQALVSLTTGVKKWGHDTSRIWLLAHVHMLQEATPTNHRLMKHDRQGYPTWTTPFQAKELLINLIGKSDDLTLGDLLGELRRVGEVYQKEMGHVCKDEFKHLLQALGNVFFNYDQNISKKLLISRGNSTKIPYEFCVGAGGDETRNPKPSQGHGNPASGYNGEEVFLFTRKSQGAPTYLGI